MQITSDLISFPFKDPEWKSKAEIGALIGLVGWVIFPVLWLIAGYGAEVVRRTIRSGVPSLPEWDDWGKLITDGLWYVAVTLVYNAPVILMYMIYTGVVMAIVFATPGLMSGDAFDAAEGVAFAGTMTTVSALSVCMGAVF